MDAMTDAEAVFDLELRLLLEALHHRYCCDFRGYVMSGLRRRVARALVQFQCESVSQLQHRVLREPALFTELVSVLTVHVSDVFRDPGYHAAVREEVVPRLRTYPSLKVWIAGCSTGEELYSTAILLREEGLLDRAVIYATDVDPHALQIAERGVYALDRVRDFSRNYQRAGGRGSLADHFTVAYDAMVFDRTLRKQVVFSDHSLATDSAFSEVHLISCRNVFIYFEPELQDRALKLFAESLVHKGFLGLGAHETLRFSAHASLFADFVPEHRIFRRADGAGS
jgi:chemotaxis protein methyltransferase CheR